MLVEFSIIPMGETHASRQIAEALKLVDASGLPYQLTPAATCVEGDWDEVFALIRRCHEQVRGMSDHVVTTIRVEDDKGESNQLERNIRSVEKRLGRRLKTAPA